MERHEQIKILKQGALIWNEWRDKNPDVAIDLRAMRLHNLDLSGVKLDDIHLDGSFLIDVNLTGADLSKARLTHVDLSGTNLNKATLFSTNFINVTTFNGCNFEKARMGNTEFANSDLSSAVGLDETFHLGPSHISTTTFARSKGKIPEAFLRSCGLNDWEIEQVKLYNPDLNNEEINNIQYKMYDLRATQALQISPLFISYSHEDSKFVNKLESQLNGNSIRFWRDIHEMKAGRMETQIDRAINQNRTVLLVLSENSLKSDWVEHEVRAARGLEKDMGRDVLCPVALDDSWKKSHWPKRVMEQIMEYNILDFSAWEDDVKFEGMFRKLIDGLELFYKDKS